MVESDAGAFPISGFAESTLPQASNSFAEMNRISAPFAMVGPAMATAASILVFFNYLFFLKWSPLTEGRWCPLFVIAITFPFAAFFASHVKRARFALAAVLLLCAVATMSFWLTRSDQYKFTYLVGFLLSSVPFFMLGAVAGHWPRALGSIFFGMACAFCVAILAAYYYHGGLWDAGGFRDVLFIPQRPGRPSFRTDYQLVAYGLAFSSIAAWAMLGKAAPRWSHHLFGIIVLVALTQLGSRGAFLLFSIAHLFLLAKTRSVPSALLGFFLLATTTVVVFTALPDSATIARAEYTNELGDGTMGNANLAVTRGVLFSRAIKGWIESPSSIVFGQGFGSYSLDLVGIYPDWLLQPTKGSIYPHNVILEAGYELGILGVLPLVTAFAWPFLRLVSARWKSASGSEIAVAMVFLMSCGLAMISGAIGYEYSLYFLLGVASVSGIPERGQVGKN